MKGCCASFLKIKKNQNKNGTKFVDGRVRHAPRGLTISKTTPLPSIIRGHELSQERAGNSSVLHLLRPDYWTHFCWIHENHWEVKVGNLCRHGFVVNIVKYTRKNAQIVCACWQAWKMVELASLNMVVDRLEHGCWLYNPVNNTVNVIEQGPVIQKATSSIQDQ